MPALPHEADMHRCGGTKSLDKVRCTVQGCVAGYWQNRQDSEPVWLTLHLDKTIPQDSVYGEVIPLPLSSFLTPVH